MQIMSLKKLLESFKYAFRGLFYIFRTEQNFRMQIFIALIVIAFMLYFPLSILERVGILILILLVLCLEIINTIVEKIANVLKPRVHPCIQVIKDLTAGAVLLSAIGSIIIALLIFLPHFQERIHFFNFH